MDAQSTTETGTGGEQPANLEAPADHSRTTDRPRRVQLRRSKGWRMPPNTVKVDRTTKWGNDFRVGEPAEYYTGHSRPVTHAEAVELHRQHAEAHASIDPHYFAELRGKNLACWCGLDEPCHADNYLALANGDAT